MSVLAPPLFYRNFFTVTTRQRSRHNFYYKTAWNINYVTELNWTEVCLTVEKYKYFCFYISMYEYRSILRELVYNIRQLTTSHRQLTIISGQLRNRNFINRKFMLLKDRYWLCRIMLMHILAMLLSLLLSAAFIYLYLCWCILSFCLINTRKPS